jgi:predicted nucleotidyltransferase
MGRIADAFKEQLGSLQPLKHELAAAQSHASSIKARLSLAFDLKKFELVGSHARQTAISNDSDVDYLAVLARDEVRWGGALVASTTLLDRVRKELAERFANTYLRKDGPAVVVHFVDALGHGSPAMRHLACLAPTHREAHCAGGSVRRRRNHRLVNALFKRLMIVATAGRYP